MTCKCGHTIEGHDYMKGACCVCACQEFQPASPPPSGPTSSDDRRDVAQIGAESGEAANADRHPPSLRNERSSDSSGSSSQRIERRASNAEVSGSTPDSPTKSSSGANEVDCGDARAIGAENAGTRASQSAGEVSTPSLIVISSSAHSEQSASAPDAGQPVIDEHLGDTIGNTPAPSAPASAAHAKDWIRKLQKQGWHCSDHFIAEFEGFAALKVAEQTRQLRSERDAWKGAIIDACIVDWIFTKEHETNPRKAVNDLLCWQSKVALDPRVSKPAHDLVERAQAAEAERDKLHAENVKFVKDICRLAKQRDKAEAGLERLRKEAK